ncbi:replication protein [uncultured Roseburia sp.]|uniref:Replication initiation protein n=1 Tax=Brotonthovivens ammoniilytica TaxID=2981725 RepID=A0ABT2THL7_9FIRM|nr:replication initiation protein [Brotonthovivens ammoniilytica]MCU6761688.1 replication initiation protein [Brotonthovivens ammoniilytica]SCI43581.1 replication protein [uncultured Roseburia sp.]
MKEEEIKKHELECFRNETITRSNSLITAKYKSSLLENKLMVLALKRSKKDTLNRPSVEISAEEIRKLSGNTGGSFYGQLKLAAKSMANRTIFIEDAEKKQFKVINLIHVAEYKNGMFSIRFTPEANEYLDDLRDNFTTMKLTTLFVFSSNYAYRLYEILKMHEYKIGKDNTPIVINYSLAELKLEMNCVNTEEKAIQRELQKDTPDYERIVNDIAKEKHLENYSDFRKNALDVAKKQINELSDLYIDYKPVRSGRGGKVVAVDIYLQRNVNNKMYAITEDGTEVVTEELLEPENMTELILDIIDYITDVKISSRDAGILLKDAGYNADAVKKAYDLSKTQTEIKNFMGWMRKCIKEDYQPSIETMSGSQEAARQVKEVHEDIESNKMSLSVKVWEKTKQKDNYPAFLQYLDSQGISEDIIDAIYSPEECLKLYVDWVKMS